MTTIKFTNYNANNNNIINKNYSFSENIFRYNDPTVSPLLNHNHENNTISRSSQNSIYSNPIQHSHSTSSISSISNHNNYPNHLLSTTVHHHHHKNHAPSPERYAYLQQQQQQQQNKQVTFTFYSFLVFVFSTQILNFLSPFRLASTIQEQCLLGIVRVNATQFQYHITLLSIEWCCWFYERTTEPFDACKHIATK